MLRTRKSTTMPIATSARTMYSVAEDAFLPAGAGTTTTGGAAGTWPGGEPPSGTADTLRSRTVAAAAEAAPGARDGNGDGLPTIDRPVLSEASSFIHAGLSAEAS